MKRIACLVVLMLVTVTGTVLGHDYDLRMAAWYRANVGPVPSGFPLPWTLADDATGGVRIVRMDWSSPKPTLAQLAAIPIAQVQAERKKQQDDTERQSGDIEQQRLLKAATVVLAQRIEAAMAAIRKQHPAVTNIPAWTAADYREAIVGVYTNR